MSFLLPKLTCKREVDQAIKSVAEKVLVLRFGRDNDAVCLQLDDILAKTAHDLSKMAVIYLVDVNDIPVYTQYFDISYIPSTVFFFNGQHMKVDYGKARKTQRRWENSLFAILLKYGQLMQKRKYLVGKKLSIFQLLFP
ncbi:thioredoxin-like protein 4B isoform X2 [Vidua macroura]|uniref:thioredoxin-like protein 4B isoform X2 n=1 Tax=Vidua chalybeata TaxID=81927 RepID=UPI0023A8D99E|nr:thioredoxin-like protein 4B isoform X2 [Vidua chalybeata]XP_053826968.1 thioredoxin-like protein 4B isoform X2 [Vidua macroura]